MAGTGEENREAAEEDLNDRSLDIDPQRHADYTNLKHWKQVTDEKELERLRKIRRRQMELRRYMK